MKRLSIIAAAVILSISGCTGFVLPDKIPQGKWNYRLLVSGLEIGSAEISNMRAGDNYESSSELKMTLAGITTISKETVVETTDFRPVRFESLSKMISGNESNETVTSAVFTGTKVELVINNKKAYFDIKKDFRLEGNYSIAKLIEGRFSEGMEVEERIYNPSIELDAVILIKTKVAGIENVDVNGKTEKLIHITQTIENVKSIDIYIDSQAVTKKAVIKMLNIKMEIIKI